LASERVACCVSFGEARHTVAAALKRSMVEAVTAPPPEVLMTLRHRGPWTALIHDLNPWDLTGVAQVEAVRQEHPDLPILLYAPGRVGVVNLLLRCARLPGVRAELQQPLGPQETERLRQVLRALLDERPRARILRMLQTVAPNAPARAWTFTELALQRLGKDLGPGPLTVQLLARNLGVSQRTLERSWHGSVLPPPKELLEWLALLLAAINAASAGTTVARAARALGIDSQRLYRLRRRLLPPPLRVVFPPRHEEFEAAFLAFVERCRGSQPLGARWRRG